MRIAGDQRRVFRCVALIYARNVRPIALEQLNIAADGRPRRLVNEHVINECISRDFDYSIFRASIKLLCVERFEVETIAENEMFRTVNQRKRDFFFLKKRRQRTGTSEILFITVAKIYEKRNVNINVHRSDVARCCLKVQVEAQFALPAHTASTALERLSFAAARRNHRERVNGRFFSYTR